MICMNFQDKQLPMLGLGTMRLPLTESGSIDETRLSEMVDYAMANGVNYFDTAYPYHEGFSEIAISKALKKYPRESYYIATKYPGHQISDSYNPAEIFAEQLKKCQVEYFDFYLLHNVYENSMGVYLDKRWNILEYFKEQKRLGRIKHLGFSTHARNDTLQRFLDAAGDSMEFCQIQLNWLDWTLQDAKGKVKLLNERNIPIWVMEPVRGGKLCTLGEAETAKLGAMRPFETVTSWGFRFLQGIEGVTVVLSGMSNMTQLTENIATFSSSEPLSELERSALFEIAEGMKSSVPCTACKYCMAGCPMGLNIPAFIETYNELRVQESTNPTMWIEPLPDDKKPSACIGCGACTSICPQSIDIPTVMQDLSKKLDTIPKWSNICKARAEAAARLKEGSKNVC